MTASRRTAFPHRKRILSSIGARSPSLRSSRRTSRRIRRADQPPHHVIAIDQISQKRSDHNALMDQLLAAVFEIGSLHCCFQHGCALRARSRFRCLVFLLNLNGEWVQLHRETRWPVERLPEVEALQWRDCFGVWRATLCFRPDGRIIPDQIFRWLAASRSASAVSLVVPALGPHSWHAELTANKLGSL